MCRGSLGNLVLFNFLLWRGLPYLAHQALSGHSGRLTPDCESFSDKSLECRVALCPWHTEQSSSKQHAPLTSKSRILRLSMCCIVKINKNDTVYIFHCPAHPYDAGKAGSEISFQIQASITRHPPLYPLPCPIQQHICIRVCSNIDSGSLRICGCPFSTCWCSTTSGFGVGMCGSSGPPLGDPFSNVLDTGAAHLTLCVGKWVHFFLTTAHAQLTKCKSGKLCAINCSHCIPSILAKYRLRAWDRFCCYHFLHMTHLARSLE